MKNKKNEVVNRHTFGTLSSPTACPELASGSQCSNQSLPVSQILAYAYE